MYATSDIVPNSSQNSRAFAARLDFVIPIGCKDAANVAYRYKIQCLRPDSE